MRILTKIFLSALCLLLCACSGAQVKQYRVKVIKEYPHDRDAYTQGLFFHEGTLFETTGQYGLIVAILLIFVAPGIFTGILKDAIK